MHCPMGDILKLIWWAVIGLFRSRASLEAEILTTSSTCSDEKPRSDSPSATSIASFLPASIDCAGRFGRLGDRQTGDGHPLASCGFSLVLAMEVANSRRQANGAARNSSADP